MKKSTTIAVTAAAVVTALTVAAGATSLYSKNKTGSYNPFNINVASRWVSGKYSEYLNIKGTDEMLKQKVKEANEFVTSKATTEFEYEKLKGYPALTQLMNYMDTLAKPAEKPAEEKKDEEVVVSEEKKGEEVAVSEEKKDEEVAVSEEKKDEEVAVSEEKKDEEVVVSEEKKDEEVAVSEEKKDEEVAVSEEKKDEK